MKYLLFTHCAWRRWRCFLSSQFSRHVLEKLHQAHQARRYPCHPDSCPISRICVQSWLLYIGDKQKAGRARKTLSVARRILLQCMRGVTLFIYTKSTCVCEIASCLGHPRAEDRQITRRMRPQTNQERPQKNQRRDQAGVEPVRLYIHNYNRHVHDYLVHPCCIKNNSHNLTMYTFHQWQSISCPK